MAQQDHVIIDYRPDQAPAMSWRGIFSALWLLSTFVTILSLVPGVAMTLGNLPGDIDAGSAGGSLRVPVVTIALLTVTLAGVYYRLSSYLADR